MHLQKQDAWWRAFFGFTFGWCDEGSDAKEARACGEGIGDISTSVDVDFCSSAMFSS